jgi:hypothetical protein
VLLDAFHGQALLEQLAQRRIVQQRDRIAPRKQHHRAQPARPRAQDVQGIGAVHVRAAHVLPEFKQVADGAREVVRVRGERGGVDRTGRGAAKDRERVACGLAQDVAQRLQHAHLVGGARAATRQHQPRPRLHPACREGRDVAGGGFHHRSI